MKQELLQPAATIAAALISTEHIRIEKGGARPPTKDLFVNVYRALEQAFEQIEEEDKSLRSDHQPHSRRALATADSAKL